MIEAFCVHHRLKTVGLYKLYKEIYKRKLDRIEYTDKGTLYVEYVFKTDKAIYEIVLHISSNKKISNSIMWMCRYDYKLDEKLDYLTLAPASDFLSLLGLWIKLYVNGPEQTLEGMYFPVHILYD
jgi:hypothetical protein